MIQSSQESGAAVEMPKYQSHKKVWALKISKATFEEDDGTLYLEFEKSDVYAPIEISGGEEARRIAKAMLSCEDKGDKGYLVVYEGGYRSWSPTEAFEGGYTPLKDSPVEKLREVTKTQCSDGNWNANSYMHGMANGMILALAIMDDVEPEYLDKPEQWEDDKTNPA